MIDLFLLVVCQEYRDEVISKCIAAEPHHGLTWQAIAKDDNNVGKKIKDILELVAAALQ